ncbi:hypothetical protein ABZW02_29865 [Streptomyces sp. NPDC005180]|uniref:hypothetical protein n=1 Tax=Streptomyces sp. NPDC005180 TaxID=3156868 RepID=UPI0033A13331
MAAWAAAWWSARVAEAGTQRTKSAVAAAASRSAPSARPHSTATTRAGTPNISSS